ncbi:unnamed protein product [Calypogeia fissa]
MSLTFLAGEFVQRWRLEYKLGTFHQWILNKRLLTMATMDPEPVQDPMEEPTPAPEPMLMERSLSSESGSNSSISTVHFAKISGSASTSRSGSAASTSRSPPDQEVAARLLSWSSPSHGQDQGQVQGHAKDDQPSSKISVHSPETEKTESAVVKKADSSSGFEQLQQQEPQEETKVIEELKKSSDTIVKEFRHTESIMIKEAEQVADACCSCCRPCVECCRSCGTWGVCGDVAAVLCCPFTVISLLSCICFKCPKFFATKTAEKVKTVKSKVKGEEQHMNKEESEFEESTGTTGKEVSPGASLEHKHKHVHSEERHDEKPEVIVTTTSSKGPASGKKDSPITSQQNIFFPSPEVEDDRPGGKKSGGR